jgi:hypothetical protein
VRQFTFGECYKSKTWYLCFNRQSVKGLGHPISIEVRRLAIEDEGDVPCAVKNARGLLPRPRHRPIGGKREPSSQGRLDRSFAAMKFRGHAELRKRRLGVRVLQYCTSWTGW